jgi:hypothetical protein
MISLACKLQCADASSSEAVVEERAAAVEAFPARQRQRPVLILLL